MRTLFLIAVLFLPLKSSAKVTLQKQRAIKELIQISALGSTELKTFHSAFKKMIKKDKKLTKTQRKKLIELVGQKINPTQIEKLYIPVYAKHYKIEEIRALIRFFKTPLEKRYLEVEPKLRADLHQAGSEYGTKVMTTIATQILMESNRQPAKKR